MAESRATEAFSDFTLAHALLALVESSLFRTRGGTRMAARVAKLAHEEARRQLAVYERQRRVEEVSRG